MHTLTVRLLIGLLLLVTCLSGCRDRSSAETSRSEYEKRLLATTAHYPFEEWQKRSAHGLDQYTAANCQAAAAAFNRLIDQLVQLGETAPEDSKLAAFRECIESLNALNRRVPNLIETGEREELCELSNLIAVAAGLDPSRYGGGEGPASEWRDW